MRRNMAFWLAVGGLLVATAKAEDKPMPTPAEQQATAAIKKLGGLVLEIAQNDSRLDVAFFNVNGYIAVILFFSVLGGRLV